MVPVDVGDLLAEAILSGDRDLATTGMGALPHLYPGIRFIDPRLTDHRGSLPGQETEQPIRIPGFRGFLLWGMA